MGTGSADTRLIVLRGNSGSGKSSVAAALREACGRGLAWVSQDLIRRTILREHDRPGGVNIGLIDQVARHCLDAGYHVVLDGILYADRYEAMLTGLHREHRGLSRFYYLDVSLDETLRRHATRPQAAEFSPARMRDWYRPRDLLASVTEQVIPQSSTLRQTTELILAQARLLAAPRVPPLRRASGNPAAGEQGAGDEAAAGTPAAGAARPPG